MDRVGSDIQGSSDNLLHIQVIVSGRAFTDTDTLVGELYVKTVFIFFGIDCYAADTHITAGADNTNSNLSAVCNQYFMKHGTPP